MMTEVEGLLFRNKQLRERHTSQLAQGGSQVSSTYQTIVGQPGTQLAFIRAGDGEADGFEIEPVSPELTEHRRGINTILDNHDLAHLVSTEQLFGHEVLADRATFKQAYSNGEPVPVLTPTGNALAQYLGIWVMNAWADALGRKALAGAAEQLVNDAGAQLEYDDDTDTYVGDAGQIADWLGELLAQAGN